MTFTDNKIACAQCQGIISSYTGRAEAVVCHHCGYALLVSMGQSFVSAKVFKSHSAAEPQIALNCEITVHGIPWRVVGFALLREKGKPFTWTEYSLYNESEGTATLSSYENTYNLVRTFQPEADFPLENVPLSVRYRGRTYRLYNKYEIQIKYARGEFFYNPAYLNGTFSREFLSPPDLIIVHDKEDKREFFRATYVDRLELQKGLGSYIPQSDFINPTQTLLKGLRASSTIWVLAGFLGILILIAFFQGMLAPEAQVYKNNFAFFRGDSSQNTIISPSFELTGWGSCLSADLEADVNNSWFAMSFELINETDNGSVYFENGVEYYSGYADDGMWSEGSRSNEVNVTGLRPGKYHLVLHPILDNSRPSLVNVKLVVSKNRIFYSNYLLIFVFAGLFPLIYFLLDYRLDRKRWYFSDYSNYTYDDE